MSLTVRELLETDEFKEYKVIAGSGGVDRKISSVSVMDAPDIYQWLRGGEILITTGYLFKDNLEFLSFLVQKIYEAEAAALFIKIGRFISELPKEVRQLAEQLNFPIVLMPLQCAFTDVINPVLSKIIWEQAEVIEYSNQIHKRFIDLTIQGKGIREVVITVSELLEKEAVYYDMLSKKMYRKDSEIQEEISEEGMRAEYTLFPVIYEDKTYGYIGIRGRSISMNDYEGIIIEHASTVIQLNIQREISNMQIEKRYRDSFVRDIIYHNINNRDEIIRRGRSFGWNLEGSYRVAVVSIDHLRKNCLEGEEYTTDKKASAVLETAVAYFKAWLPGLIYTGFSDYMVLLVREEENTEQQYMQLSRKIMKIIQEQYKETISVMLGTLKKDIYEADKSFQEAQYTLNMAYVFGDSEQVLFYDHLGIYRLLDKLREDISMKRFSNDSLCLLEEYDRCHDSEYEKTLEAIIDNNWNLKQVAEKHFMHYNTIKKRYHKIEEILGVDFENMSERMGVELAIKYRRVSERHG